MSDLINRSELIKDIRSRSYINNALAEIFETIIDEQSEVSDKEIRDKAIFEFSKKIKEEIEEFYLSPKRDCPYNSGWKTVCECIRYKIDEIAEQMKEVGE